MFHCGVQKVRLIVCLKAEDNMGHFVFLSSPFRVIQAIRYADGCWLRMLSCAIHRSIFEQPVIE
jgi:hypothetical protein